MASESVGLARATGTPRRVDRRLVTALLELLALTGIAVAQPLLDVLGKAPEVLIFHQATRTDIVLLAVAAILVPPLALWALELAARAFGERVWRVVHLALLAALLVLVGLEAGKKLLPLRGPALAAVAVVGAAVGTVLLARTTWARLWLRYLAVAPLLFALLFVLVSPASELLTPASTDSAGGSATAAAPARPLPPIVFVMFDEFPLQSLLDHEGRIDRRLYPNLAELARDATWYRNATTVAPGTTYAVPAILAGKYPRRSAAPAAQAYPNNLFTLLDPHYDLRVSEWVTQLCPPERCAGGGAAAPPAARTGLRAMLEDSARLLRDVVMPYDKAVDSGSLSTAEDAQRDLPSAEKLTQASRFHAFVRSIHREDPDQTLHFLHVLMPHQPWRYLPSGKEYNWAFLGKDIENPSRWPASMMEAKELSHLLQVAYTDKLVGELVKRLKDEGLYDRSLVVLTADHGTSFVAGERPRVLNQRNIPSLAWVPVLVKAPGQREGRVDDRNWEQVDLLPTIADLIGLEIPWEVDGVAQNGAPGRPDGEKSFFNVAGRRMVIDGPPNWKQVLRGVTDSRINAAHGERGIYEFGPTASWMYKPPSAVGTVGGRPAAATVLGWDQRFTTVDPAADKVPVLVRGEVTSGVPPAGARLLVAVNGQVAGTSGFFFERLGDPATRFAVLVPDFLLEAGPGHRQFQLYLVTEAGGRRHLQPVRVSDAG